MMKKRPLPVLTSILRIIELHSEMVEPVSFAEPVCSDPDDDKFLEAALAANADYVVSGDAALLKVKQYRGIAIVRPTQFLDLLSRRWSGFLVAWRCTRTVPDRNVLTRRGLTSSAKQVPQVVGNIDNVQCGMELLDIGFVRPRQARYQAALRPTM
jgi:PIN domain